MANSMTGSSGNDALQGTAGSDFVTLGEGADTYSDEHDASDTILGGAGNDLIQGGNGNDSINGDTGNDFLEGGEGDDSISGGDDADYINGNAGNDYIVGDAGNDSLNGGIGHDTMSGGTGIDWLNGGTGINILNGNEGSDSINSSGASLDTIIAGDGDHIILERSKNRHITIDGDNASLTINPTGFGYASINGEGSENESITLHLNQEDTWNIAYNNDENSQHDYTVFNINNEKILLRSIEAITVSQPGHVDQTIDLISNTSGDAHDYGTPQYLEIDSLVDFASAINDTTLDFTIKHADPERLEERSHVDLNTEIKLGYTSNTTETTNNNWLHTWSKDGIGGIEDVDANGNISLKLNASLFDKGNGGGANPILSSLKNDASLTPEERGQVLLSAKLNNLTISERLDGLGVGHDSTRAVNAVNDGYYDYYNTVYTFSDNFWTELNNVLETQVEASDITLDSFKWNGSSSNNLNAPLLDLSKEWSSSEPGDYRGIDLSLGFNELALYELNGGSADFVNIAGAANNFRVQFEHSESGQMLEFTPADHESEDLSGGRHKAFKIQKNTDGAIVGTEVDLRISYPAAVDSDKQLANTLQRAYKSDVIAYLEDNGSLEGFTGESKWNLKNIHFSDDQWNSAYISNANSFFLDENNQGGIFSDISFLSKPLFGYGQQLPEAIDPSNPALIESFSDSDYLEVSLDGDYQDALNGSIALNFNQDITDFGHVAANLHYKLIGFENNNTGNILPITEVDYNDYFRHSASHLNLHAHDGSDVIKPDLGMLEHAYRQATDTKSRLINDGKLLAADAQTAVFALEHLNTNFNFLDETSNINVTRNLDWHNIRGYLENLPAQPDPIFAISSNGFDDYTHEELLPNLNDLGIIKLGDLQLYESNGSLPWHGSIDPNALDITSARLSTPIDEESSPEGGAIDYFYTVNDLSNTVQKQIAVLGDSVDHDARYDLNITADILNNYMIEGADITIGFDAQLFNSINASDITIGSNFPIANAVEINNDLGTIRLAAATLSQLALNGDDISGDTVLASISLDFDEQALAGIAKNVDGSLVTNPLAFTIDANLDETVFSSQLEDGSGFENRKIQTLRDLGGTITVDGQDVTLYEAQINLQQQGDGLVLGTQREIGSDRAFTNLVRSGDTLTTSADWLNVGNIRANNIVVQALSNANATLASSSITQNSLNSGSFIDGVFVEDGREDLTLTADIHITGQAGNVLDLSDGILSIQADGSNVFSNAGQGSSNLITFQGDLNYDGRVSMKDLAYLNAGAARQQNAVAGDTATDADGNGIIDASVAKDVDADFNGKIELADLAVLDNDWGKTLHTGDEQFQGSADVSWNELDAQGDAAGWDNSTFKDQNAIESDPAYIGSLESPTTTGVIGADGNTTANDNDITGTNFQDPFPA